MVEDDDNLWKTVTKDVKPLRKGKAKASSSKARRLAIHHLKPRVTEPSVSTVRAGVHANKDQSARQVDKNTRDRLRSGKLDIDARLDLHGFTLRQGQEELTRKLFYHHSRGRRNVLVITGQSLGKKEENDRNWWESKPGKLRQSVPEWLSMPPLSEIVLQFYTAKPKDGGAGALYVLLRRKNT